MSDGNPPAAVGAYFDLTNGVVGAANGCTSSIAPVAGLAGLYRCSITVVNAADFVTLGVQTANNQSYFYTAAGTETISVGFVNDEVGAYPTTYIATTTVAVTRNKDVPDDQVASNITAAAGTALLSWTPSHAPSGTVALAGSYVDASNYTALLHDATKYIFRKRIAGVNYDAEYTAAFVSGTTYKVAVKWGAAGTQIAVDGVAGTAHANATDAQLGTRWQWGADGNGGQQAGAAFKEKYLWTSALTDAQLVTITTP